MLTPSDDFLSPCQVIDFDNFEVQQLAARLATGRTQNTVKACFEFVRDAIRHSADYQLNPVTCSASEVLKHGTGYCYAKSHLLAALLRANGVCAGLCYQRLSIDGKGAPYSLHGLNAVFLPNTGWYRLDARGNRSDIHAEFDPPNECLAFTTTLPEEFDLPEIHARPLAVVIDALDRHKKWDLLLQNLPDVTGAPA